MPATRFAHPLAFSIPLGIALTLVLVGCSDSEPDLRRRVLLFGIDGGTLRIIQPMMKDGRLPALASIARDGVHGHMRSYFPLESPRIWTSIATGKKPTAHGVDTFTAIRPNGEKRLVNSLDRKVHAIWNMASSGGLSVATVNWWVTYPPERINGVMVSDHFLPGVIDRRKDYFHADADTRTGVVYPEEWTERVTSVVMERERMEGARDPFADAILPEWVERDKLTTWHRDDASVGAIALEVVESLQPDLMLVMFKGVDAASHVLMATAELPNLVGKRPPGTPEQIEGGAEALRLFYEHIDGILGQMLEHYGPNDLVLIVSDHGFETRNRYTALTGQHKGPVAMQALLLARGEGIEPGGRLEKVDIYQITPTILTWLGLPVGNDMDGTTASFLNAPVAGRVATWDKGRIERMQPGKGSAEDEIMEQLEALGYFEDEEAAKSGAEGDSHSEH
jgi:predicted AlkP superfamily phosphohydrolase/phosphomutase